MKIQIKSRFSGKVIFEHEAENNSWKLTVELAWENKINLSEADLSEANLSRADLSEANLSRADLFRADLSEADLSEANLSRANLFRANLSRANLSEADLSRADLFSANLSEADLFRTDLSRANLSRANLSRADLYGADLFRADLSEADLSEAKNCYPKLYRDNLGILKCQPTGTKLRAYKYLDDNMSPYQNFKYEIGKEYKSDELDTNDTKLCAPGINLATLEWCLKNTNCDLDKTYIECEFEPQNVIVPFNSDGKFRVDKIKVLRKLTKKELQNFLKTGSLGKLILPVAPAAKS